MKYFVGSTIDKVMQENQTLKAELSMAGDQSNQLQGAQHAVSNIDSLFFTILVFVALT